MHKKYKIKKGNIIKDVQNLFRLEKEIDDNKIKEKLNHKSFFNKKRKWKNQGQNN